MGSRDPRRKPADSESEGETAEDVFRAAAEREGLTYHEWCKRNGILDPAARRRIRRHEVPLKDRDNG